jgi:hypothetical protein
LKEVRMSYQELISRHKVKSDVSDLDPDERELYAAFVALGETATDRRILGNAWLKHHASLERV